MEAPVGSLVSAGAQVMYFNRDASGNPPQIEQLDSKSIQGVQADGTRASVIIVDEVWRSSDLNVLVSSGHSDPRMGKTVYALTNVSRAEPSPTLFQVAADYTVKDAQTNMRFERRLPPPPQ